jgi:hypothetical protein
MAKMIFATNVAQRRESLIAFAQDIFAASAAQRRTYTWLRDLLMDKK